MHDTETDYDFEDALLEHLHKAAARRSVTPTIVSPFAGRRARVRRTIPAAAAIVGAAAAVAAFSLATASSDSARGHTTRAADTPARLSAPLSSDSVRHAVLAAFDTNAGDILHVHQVVSTAGEPTMDQDIWQSPVQPAPGATARLRSLIVWNGTPQQDVETIWTQPPAGTPIEPPKYGSNNAQTVTGELIDIEYTSRTWSDQKSTPITAGLPGADQIQAEIASGQFTVQGQTTVNGKEAIQLSLVGLTVGSSETIWVDATSYLPIKSIFTSPSDTTSDTYSLLPPTSENLTDLNVSVPPGFTVTAAPPTHPNG